MISIGLVGEDPNDTSSIKNLLLSKYGKSVRFFPLARGICGYYLDNPKLKAVLKAELASHNYKFIIYIRDLDAFKSEAAKVQKKLDWFKDLNSITGNQNILLLNIWEMEALILGDIGTFNKIYKIKHSFSGDPMAVKEPKEYLKRITNKGIKRYKESHSPEIFSQLDINLVRDNCLFFRNFLTEFNSRLFS